MIHSPLAHAMSIALAFLVSLSVHTTVLGGGVCDNAPSITSNDNATFTVGNSEDFTVTTSGGGAPIAMYCNDSFPDGVTFQDNFDGTASLFGTPQPGSSGTYPLTIQAYSCDGDGAGSSQQFTLYVVEGPAFTSADNATFTEGENGTFTVTTTGDPPISLSLYTDNLPAGVGFVDNGDGTATVSGTPLVGTAGSYSPDFQACNNVSCTIQNFTLGVDATTASPSGTECGTPPGGMIGWWPGDGNLSDIQAGNNGSENNGGPTFASGEAGQAMDFNGTTQFVTVPSIPDPNSAYSFDAWVYWRGNINTSDHEGIVVKMQDTTVTSNDSYSMFIYAGDNSLYNVVGGAVAVNTLPSTVPMNEWFHVAQTNDGSNVKVYINGNLAGINSASRDTSDGPLYFGNRAGNDHHFNGLLDEIEIFNRELTQDEVRAIFNAGSFGKCKCTPPPPDLISWWAADGDATDVRGLHDGTLHGDTSFVSGKVSQAFSFDGNGDYVDVGDVDVPGTFTIDAWIYPASFTGGPMIISKDDASANHSYHFQVGVDGKLIARVTSAAGVTHYFTTSPVVGTNGWTHVAVTYDGNAPANQRFTFYVNGIAVPATPIPGSDSGGAPLNVAEPARIGTFGPALSNAFSGLIDEVEVFGRVLCAQEIQALYDAGTAGKCKPKLNVDYGSSDASSAIQPGFFGINLPDGVGSSWFTYVLPVDLATAPSGRALIHIQGPDNFVTRDRTGTPSNSGAFTFNNLYRDFVLTGSPLQITLGDLTPNTVFDVIFYAYDDDAIIGNPSTNTDTFKNTTFGGSVPAASVTYGPLGGKVSSNHQYSTRMRVVSDGSGALSFEETSAGPEGGPVLNGLQVAPVTLSGPCAAPTPAALQLLNISSRADVQTGDNVAIAGFIVRTESGGTAQTSGLRPHKKVLIRGRGPSLALTGTLADPVLDLFDPDGMQIDHNDNWMEEPDGTFNQARTDEINATGLAPTDASEAAIIATLLQNAGYTAILSGAGETSGIGLVEVYDLEPTNPSRLGNISTRAFVGTSDNVLIGGFIVRGDDPVNFLIRALGPSLAPALGAPNVLPDPQVDLFDANGMLIAHNDDWKYEPDGTPNAARETQIMNTGLAPGNDLESAIFYPVPPPGPYTAIVSGIGLDQDGIGMVEVYELGPPSP